MRKTEIDRKLDEIVAFSEIENFLDTPVERYSSGMYVRLAFAVAAPPRAGNSDRQRSLGGGRLHVPEEMHGQDARCCH